MELHGGHVSLLQGCWAKIFFFLVEVIFFSVLSSVLTVSIATCP